MVPLMKADTPDRAAIEAQIDKVVTARADLEKANARFLLDVRMQLKPDQWKQLQTMRENRMARERMREHGPGAWGEGGSRPGMGGQFRRPQAPPPAEPPQGAPAPASRTGITGPGNGKRAVTALTAAIAVSRTRWAAISKMRARRDYESFTQRADTVDRQTGGGRGISPCRHFLCSR